MLEKSASRGRHGEREKYAVSFHAHGQLVVVGRFRQERDDFGLVEAAHADLETLLPQIEIEGEVIWVNPFRPGAPDNLHPGMGIRFVELENDLRDRLLELVRRFAYLS